MLFILLSYDEKRLPLSLYLQYGFSNDKILKEVTLIR